MRSQGCEGPRRCLAGVGGRGQARPELGRHCFFVGFSPKPYTLNPQPSS